MDMSFGKLWELVMDRRPDVLQFMSRKESDTTERMNWTELKLLPNEGKVAWYYWKLLIWGQDGKMRLKW